MTISVLGFPRLQRFVSALWSSLYEQQYAFPSILPAARDGGNALYYTSTRAFCPRALS